MSTAIIIDHPLIKHKLTLLRKKDTSPAHFRVILKEISFLLAFEVTKGLPLENKEIETPVCKTIAPILAGKKMCIFSILRAGEGLAQGLLELIPSAKAGHVGIYRDEESLDAVEYYFKAPADLDKRFNLVVDPMLATGCSAIAALNKIKNEGGKNITFLCLLAAPEGIIALNKEHTDVQIYTAAIDTKLNEKGYIVPGLGDAGDRIFGT